MDGRYFARVDPSTHAQAGVALILHPRLTDAVLDWKQINKKVPLIRLEIKENKIDNHPGIHTYGSRLRPFLDIVLTATKSVPKVYSLIITADFNAHVGNDSQTWNDVIRRNGNKALNNQGRQLLDFMQAVDCQQ